VPLTIVGVTKRRATTTLGVIAALLVLVALVLVVGERPPPQPRPGPAAGAGQEPAVQRVQAAVTAILAQRAHDALASRVSPTSLARLRRTVAPALLANQVALARHLAQVPLVAYSLEAVNPPTWTG